MPRKCSICTHPKRRYIERSMLKKSLRDIAVQYGVSKSALQNHKKHIQKALAKVEQANGQSFQDRFDALYQQLEKLEAEAQKISDKVAIIREKKGMLQMFVQLGYQEALRRQQQQEKQKEFTDVTPAVLQIIEKEFED